MWPVCVFKYAHEFVCLCSSVGADQGDRLGVSSLLSQRSFWGSAQVVRLVCKCLTLALSSWFLAFTSQVLELLCLYPA